MKTKLFHRFLGVCLLLTPYAGLYAAMNEVPSPSSPESMPAGRTGYDLYNAPIPMDNSRFYGEFLYTMFVLGCVIAAMLFATWFIRRMLAGKVQHLNQTHDIKILETRALGHKSLLHLIDVKGTTVLISETPSGITPLLKFKGEESFAQLMDSKEEADRGDRGQEPGVRS